MKSHGGQEKDELPMPSLILQWKKIKVWCAAHWKWLIFSVASLFALVFGYSKSREFKITGQLAKKNFDKERKIIENSGKELIADHVEAHEVHDKAHEKNVLSFEKKKEELRKEKLRRLLDKPEADPKEISDFLDEMGIDEE